MLKRGHTLFVFDSTQHAGCYYNESFWCIFNCNTMIQEIRLQAYLKEYGEHWADQMPDNCPPEEVCISDGDTFYRFTLNEDRVIQDDWKNYLTLYPNRKCSDEMRPYFAGLSLMDSQEAAENKMKLPKMKKLGFKGLAKISLIQEDGVFLPTFGANHDTWWRTTMCNLAKAQMV